MLVFRLGHLGPGFEHGQFLHGGGALAVQLAGRAFTRLHFVQRGHQQVVDPPQVVQVAHYTAADPGTAHLRHKMEGEED